MGGNTAGASTIVSSGTLTLAGGNNITLSQNGNAITISGANGGAAGSQTLGISNLGNTIGTSGVISASAVRMLFAGGNNVTLSQSTNGASGTITVSAANQTVQTQNLHNVTLSGNTAGAMAQVSSGTLTLAGGNNVTLSQNGNAVTVSGPNTVAQSVQTQNLHNVTIGSNTAGAGAAISSGTLTLAGGDNITISQNGGNALTIHGAVGGGAAGTNTLGISNLGNTSGTSGVITGSNLQLAFAGGNNVTLSQSINASSATITISAGAGGGAAPTGSYFDNMFQQNSVQGISYSTLQTGSSGIVGGRLLLQPLAPGNELFPYDMTASTMLLNFSNNSTSTSAISAAHSSTWYLGIYTRVNSTQLSLLNSVSTSYSMSANAGNSASYRGARWLSFHSSLWSSAPAFQEGSRYFFGLLALTGGAFYSSHSIAGMHLGQSIQRSGFMATAASSNTSFNAWHPFMGVHATTNHAGLPASIANSQINKATPYANFIPQVIFDAGLGAVN